ncbi:hypothetical protein KW783_01015 [Candidatus Parcubacteria bacterium]|nr:hypothetical protein [Candidatus Parcubacteria bacterium]
MKTAAILFLICVVILNVAIFVSPSLSAKLTGAAASGSFATFTLIIPVILGICFLWAFSASKKTAEHKEIYRKIAIAICILAFLSLLSLFFGKYFFFF